MVFDIMSRRGSFRRSRRNNEDLICFFCLRPVKPSEAKIVIINDELIGMNFRVIACKECASKYGNVVKLKAS